MSKSYPNRTAYQEYKRENYAEQYGPRCMKCGGRAPQRVCPRCGRLPRLIKPEQGNAYRELER